MYSTPKNGSRFFQSRLSSLEAASRRELPNLRWLQKPSLMLPFESKSAFFDLLGSHDELYNLTPRYVPLYEADDVDRAIERLGLPMLIRRDRASNGSETFLCKDKKAILAALAHLKRERWHRFISKMNRSFHGRLLNMPGIDLIPDDEIIAVEWIDSTSATDQGFCSLCCYYVDQKMTFFDPRWNPSNWNIHAGNSAIATMSKARQDALMRWAIDSIKANRKRLDRVSNLLGQFTVRLDCVVSASGELRVLEAEMKGGPGPKVRESQLSWMSDVGWSIPRLRDTAELHEVTDPLMDIRDSSCRA